MSCEVFLLELFPDSPDFSSTSVGLFPSLTEAQYEAQEIAKLIAKAYGGHADVHDNGNVSIYSGNTILKCLTIEEII